MAVTIAVVLDTRRKKNSGAFPVKLRVTLNRKSEHYTTIYDLTESDFEKLTAKRISESLHKTKKQLIEIESTAIKEADKINPFSFKEFEGDFIKGNPLFMQRTNKKVPVETDNAEFDLKPFERRISLLREVHPDNDYISVTFLNCIIKLLEERKIGSALNYQDAYNSLKRFKGNVRFSDITVSYLNQYEQWMIFSKNRSKTTVGIRLRALRAVFNEAIEKGIIKKDKCYPFGRKRYQIPTSRNIKKALDLSDVKKIYDFQPTTENEQKARDFWLFCYFGNGMNPKDMAYLRYKNIDGEYIHFTRAKTEHTVRREPKLVTVYFSEDMRRIVHKWGNKDESPNNFVFPILNHQANIMEQYNIVKRLVVVINEGMEVITAQVGIKKKVTNKVTRHTFSTVLKRSGVSTEFIQEALGHTDKKTTENYLDSFEKEVKKEYALKLLAFDNVSSS